MDPDTTHNPNRRAFLRALAGVASSPLAAAAARTGVVAGASSLLAACNDERPVDQLTRRLIVGMKRDIKSLDPAYQIMALDGSIIANIQENLTWYDRNLRLIPRLATSWEAHDQAKTWIFHLRQGVKFHDGTPFNAEAAKFHFDRIADPKTASNRLTRVARLEGVDIVDEYTIRFRMKVPFSTWPEIIRDPWACIVSPTAVKKLKDHKDYTRHPVGTGPFQFVEYMPDDHILLKRNPNYWGGDVIKFEELEFRPIREATTRLILLEQGKVDLADIFYGHLDAVKKSNRIKVDATPMLAIRYIGMNTQKPPFNDVRVRRAVNHAVDRNAIVKYAFRGNADPAMGPLPPALPVFNREMTKYDYDPEKARALLKEAGHTKPIKVNLWGIDEPDDKVLAETVVEQLRAVGVEIEATFYDRAVYWDKFDPFLEPNGTSYPRKEGIFDMFIAGWVGGESAYGYLDPLFRTGSNSNNAFYTNAEVDRLLTEVMATADVAQQEEIFKKIQATIVSDAPWIFTYHTHILKAYNPRITGWKTHPADEYEFQNMFLGTGKA
jgi:ABC-type transport system substrate-binding protein